MASNDHAYYSGVSGLTPPQKFSVADHKAAYIAAQSAAVKPTLTVANLNRQLGR